MESGNITRQEAVSMLPPLFLDVHPKQLVRQQEAGTIYATPRGGGGRGLMMVALPCGRFALVTEFSSSKERRREEIKRLLCLMSCPIGLSSFVKQMVQR